MQATGAAGSSDGSIVDGVSSSIKATVFDYTTSNPLATTLVDTNGDPVSVGGGTQYTEDAAAPANPVGTAVNLVRQDTPATLVSTDGDNVTQRGTNYGAGYVQVLTSSGSFVDTFGGGTQYTEDVASAADPVGTMGIAVRADSLAAVTSTDGDNIANRSTNKGELYVKHVDSIPVTAASAAFASGSISSGAVASGAFASGALASGSVATGAIVAGAVAAGATSFVKLEDVASADADAGVPAMAIQKATPANTAGTDGDYAMLQMSAGRLWASATIDAALPAGTNAIGKLSANSGVDIGDVDITSIATGTNAIGRVGHDITGIGHGVKTVAVAGTDEALAGSTACKRVVIQAQTDNTSGVAVGAAGVDATVATGTGVYLNPGDAFELEIDNLADVFIDALVSGEGARYTYFN